MSVPSWWQFALIVLGAYRVLRLVGWDEFPLAAKLRGLAIGEHWIPCEPEDDQAEKAAGRIDAAQLGLPGKQPTSQVAYVRPAYRRPTLAHLVHCPFCAGWWISLACWGAFQLSERWTLVALTPFAVSGAVGLVAKNLDP